MQDDANSSAELLKFHEAVSNLVEAEELLVDHHKSLIQVLYERCLVHILIFVDVQETKGFLEEEEKLLCYVDGIDYDIGSKIMALMLYNVC